MQQYIPKSREYDTQNEPDMGYDEDFARANSIGSIKQKSQLLEPLSYEPQLDASRDNSRQNNNSVNYGQPPKSSHEVLGAAGGRALLHDLDSKFNEQDRMLKYLMAQIQGIEDGQSNMKDQQYKVRDGDMQSISKLENQMKFE